MTVKELRYKLKGLPEHLDVMFDVTKGDTEYFRLVSIDEVEEMMETEKCVVLSSYAPDFDENKN
jgi:hypothetical protein